MAAADILAFIAPEFATLDPALITQALAMAEAQRPWCLTQALGDEAVALYAAWLLSVRGGQSSSVQQVVAQGPLIQEREGDMERRWASPGTYTVDAVATGGYKPRFDALARLCGYGAITTRDVSSPGVVP